MDFFLYILEKIYTRMICLLLICRIWPESIRVQIFMAIFLKKYFDFFLDNLIRFWTTSWVYYDLKAERIIHLCRFLSILLCFQKPTIIFHFSYIILHVNIFLFSVLWILYVVYISNNHILDISSWTSLVF